MRTLRLSLAGAVTLMLFGGILSAGVLAQEDPADTTAEAPPGEPFGGLLTGTVSFVPMDPPTEACPMVTTITEASGPTTLGTMSVYSEHCPTMGMPSIPVGEMTLTSEDGDTLSGSYYVDCDPIMPTNPAGEPVLCNGRIEFVGGTGRFEEASGTAFQRVVVWFPGTLEAQEWPWVNEFHGLLSY